MRTRGRAHWAAAFGAALGLHLACASAYVGWAPRRVPPAGAFDQGTGGVEIGVGRVGSYADLAECRDAPDEEQIELDTVPIQGRTIDTNPYAEPGAPYKARISGDPRRLKEIADTPTTLSVLT